MQRLRLFSIQVYLFLVLSSACLAAVTPRDDISLATVKEITKYAQQFSRSVPHVRKTTITPHNFPSKASKALLHSVSISRLHSLNIDWKMRTDSLGTIVDAISARITPFKVSSRQSGLNFDICSSSDDCVGPRFCVEEEGGELIICVTGEACVCAQIDPAATLCVGEGDCDTGESCIPGQSEPGTLFCVSNTAGTSSSSESDSDSPSNGDGLNLDPCSDDSDCASPRRCGKLEGDNVVLCNSGQGCACIPTTNDFICTSDSNCDSGESCVLVQSNMVCLSDDVIEQPSSGSDPGPPSNSDNDSSREPPRPGNDSGPSSNIDDDSPSEQPGPGSDSESPSNDDDTSSSEQPGTGSDSVLPSNDDDDSSSEQPGPESDSGDDSESENESTDSAPDDSSSDSSGGDEEPSSDQPQAVCIGSESLTHLTREELAFEQDALAHVLCDMNESCATPGHMVVYRGEALMMKNYCKVVGCARRVKRVNSPKYIRKLVIPSKTQDLVFTALAARFETLAEEGVLSAAVRFGL